MQRHIISIENMYGTTITQLASNSSEKKKLQMLITIGNNHSPLIDFRVINGVRSATFSFLNQAVEEYNK